MAVNLKQNEDGSMGLQGVGLDDGGFVVFEIEWSPTSVDKVNFVASRSFVVKAITARVDAAGTDAGSVTAIIRKAASGVAITAGTALHSGTIALKGTVNTNQVLTLSTTKSDLLIAAGDAIGIDFTGVLTTAVGSVTVTLAPR